MSPNELSELAPIAATLNKESNEINSVIASLNEELGSLNLGISIWLPYPSKADSRSTIGFTDFREGKPQYRRDENGDLWEDDSSFKWQLAIRRRMGPEDAAVTELEYVPLLRSSRNLRIEALQEAPMILRLLKEEAESRISAIQRAKQLVSELSSERRAKS